jgi:hypothetical protein
MALVSTVKPAGSTDGARLRFAARGKVENFLAQPLRSGEENNFRFGQHVFIKRGHYDGLRALQREDARALFVRAGKFYVGRKFGFGQLIAKFAAEQRLASNHTDLLFRHDLLRKLAAQTAAAAGE